MAIYTIKKGRDINLRGSASKEVVSGGIPSEVAIQPHNFRGIRLRLLLKEGDAVKVGTPILEDKNDERIKIVSPVSGTLKAVVRGDKRLLLRVVLESDGAQEKIEFPRVESGQIKSLSRSEIISRMLESGLWPVLRQRPYSNIAQPDSQPKAIFVQAMNTDPLALDIDHIMHDHFQRFQAGIDILNQLTEGTVYVCTDARARSKALTQVQNASVEKFSGPHPAGNVSTHIHFVSPIQKGELVWYLRAEDVLRVAALFADGVFDPSRYAAITGENAPRRTYVKTIIGASMKDLLGAFPKEGSRVLSGSVLSGEDVGSEGFLRFYDSQVTVLPAGGQRELLGWIMPGSNKFSFSKTFVSSFSGGSDVSLNTDENGSHRAIVLNHLYDEYVPLNILVYFLLKAVIAGDIEEAERLGILEVDEEDFALCTFACPSKTDVGGIIRQGLDYIEKEG